MRIGSLKEVLKKPIKAEVQAKEERKVEEKPAALSYSQASEKEVRSVLKVLATQLQTEQKMSLYSYFIDPILKVVDNKVEFILGSKSLKFEIEEAKHRIQKAFNDSGYNPDFKLSINVKKVEEYKVFTPKQQFEALAKKHPVLKEFEERFGLDFDI